MRVRYSLTFIFLLSTLIAFCLPTNKVVYKDSDTLKTIDLSGDTTRQVIVARGTESVYQGHPTTVLLPDGKTMYCVWTYDHGGECGPLKRSDDGGLTWSDLLNVPDNWRDSKNCPTIYRLPDPTGQYRLFVYAQWKKDNSICYSMSEDDGRTWSDMQGTQLGPSVMPFCTIEPTDDGKKLLAMTNLRRPGENKETRSNVLAQSISTDGGFSWSPWEIVLDLPGLKPCEPEIVRSPSGKQLLCLIRENEKHIALFMTSDDEGKTWSEAKPLPHGLHGDRHKAKYSPDGRLVVVFRDMGNESPTRKQFVAWIGSYDDIISGKSGDYKLKLLHNYKEWADCGYPGIECLPDGTFVATTYIKYRPGPEKNSVISVRFHLDKTDGLE